MFLRRCIVMRVWQLIRKCVSLHKKSTKWKNTCHWVLFFISLDENWSTQIVFSFSLRIERKRIDQTCLNVSTVLTTLYLSVTLMCIQSFARCELHCKCTPSRPLLDAGSTFSVYILHKILCVLRSWTIFGTQPILNRE